MFTKRNKVKRITTVLLAGLMTIGTIPFMTTASAGNYEELPSYTINDYNNIEKFGNETRFTLSFPSLLSTVASVSPSFNLQGGDVARFNVITGSHFRIGITINTTDSTSAIANARWANSNGVVIVPSAGNWRFILQNTSVSTINASNILVTLQHSHAFSNEFYTLNSLDILTSEKNIISDFELQTSILLDTYILNSGK